MIGQGMCVVDTDQLAREALSPGQPAYDTVMERLKGACRLEDGTLDRSALGHLVFNDDKKRRWLEGLLHPVIRQAWESRLHAWETEACPMAVVVIPLLFETNGEKHVDYVIVVSTSEKIQRERVLKRPDMTDDKFNKILISQIPNTIKCQKADFIIDTSISIDDAEKQALNILEEIEKNERNCT